MRVKLDPSCFKSNKLIFTHKALINIYLVYEINLWPFKWSSDFMLGNFLLRAVKLTKNFDLDQYKYSSCGIGFDVNETFRLCNGNGFGKNVIISGADMSSSVHIDNKKTIFWFLVKFQHKG